MTEAQLDALVAQRAAQSQTIDPVDAMMAQRAAGQTIAVPNTSNGISPQARQMIEKAASPGWLESAEDGIANIGTSMVAAPISNIAGLAATAYDVATGNKDGDPGGFKSYVQDALTWKPRTSGGQAIADVAALPAKAVAAVAAPVGNAIRNIAPSSEVAQGVGNAVEEAINQGGQIAAVKYLPQAVGAFKGRVPEGLRGPARTPIEASWEAAPQEATASAAATPNVETPVAQAAPTSPTGPTGASTVAPATPSQAATPDVSEQSPDELAAARIAEANSLPVPVDLTKGQATDDIHQISWEQNNKGAITALGDRFKAQNDALTQNLDAIRNNVTPDVDVAPGVATDQALVDAIKGVDAPVRADISAKYQALKDANGGEFPLSGQDFVNAADAALKADNVTRFVPTEVNGLLDDLRDGGPMTFNDFENYRTILGQQARKFAQSGDGTAEHAVGLVRNALESLPMSDEAAAIKPLADAARQAAAARFATIAADPAYKAAINDGVPIGEPSPVADGFIQKYVMNGKTANVKNLVNNLKGDSTAQQIMGAGLVDNLKQAAGIDLRTNTGNVSQANLNKAIVRLGQKKAIVLDPQSAAHVDALGNVARYTQEQPRGSYVNNSNTFVASAANTAKSAVEGYLNHKIPFAALGTKAVNFLGKREAAKLADAALNPQNSLPGSQNGSGPAQMSRNDAQFFQSDHVAEAEKAGIIPQVDLPAGADVKTRAFPPIPEPLSAAQKTAQSANVDVLNQALTKQGEQPVTPQFRAPTADHAVARALGKAFGTDVQFVSGAKGFDGVAHSGVAYLSDTMKRPALAIAGHEVFHTLEQSSPAVAQALTDNIKQYLQDDAVSRRQQWEQLRSKSLVSEKYATSEVMADLHGSMWLDPKFWREMAQRDPSVFRQVAYRFMEVGSRAVESLTGTRFDAGALVKDVGAVRSVIAQTWAEHLQGRSAGAADAGTGAQLSRAPATSAPNFVSAPDGSLDFGEITPEQAAVMRRQAGKIRLERGVHNPDGTGHGLAHIEANHGDQIRGAGFGSPEEFVSHVAKDFGQVWQAPGRQILVAHRDGAKTQNMMYVQLEPAKDATGDYYRVNTAFPVRRADYPENHGFTKLWDGREPTSTVTGKQPAFAGQPENVSRQTTPNARGQSATSVAQSQTTAKAPAKGIIAAAMAQKPKDK